MDRVTGDGDLGVSMARAAKADRRTPLTRIRWTIFLQRQRTRSHATQRIRDSVRATLRSALSGAVADVLEDQGIPDSRDGPMHWLEGCQAISELGARNRAIAPCWMLSIPS